MLDRPGFLAMLTQLDTATQKAQLAAMARKAHITHLWYGSGIQKSLPGVLLSKRDPIPSPIVVKHAGR